MNITRFKCYDKVTVLKKMWYLHKKAKQSSVMKESRDSPTDGRTTDFQQKFKGKSDKKNVITSAK